MNHQGLLLTPGNKKLGTSLIWSFSLPSGTEAVCPGSTALCRRACYARKLEHYRPRLRAAYARNFRLSRRRNFAARMAATIRAHFVRVLRVHVGGDYYSARYARKWLRVVRRLRRVRFFFYTRSWRVPDIRAVLEGMAALPNCYAWYSCDAETGLPEVVPPGVRLAWLQSTATERPPAPVDLVFRVRPLRRWPAKPLALAARVCPEQDGRKRTTPVTCERCQHCFREASGLDVPDSWWRGAGRQEVVKARGPPRPPQFNHLITISLKGRLMGAQRKLNQAYLTGTLLTAAVLGGISSSWAVFAAAAGIGVVLNLVGGDLRGFRRR